MTDYDLKEVQETTSSPPFIAIVIPCYGVCSTILDVLTSVEPEVSCIFCVDDACPEGSGHYIEEHFGDPRVRVLYLETNQGVGGATVVGFLEAINEGADFIIKIDGDGQMDPRLLSRFLRPIIEGSADYTKGNRFYELRNIREMPIARIFGNAILSFLTKLSSGYWNIFDPTNGYLAIHGKVAKELPLDTLSKGYFFESDMLFHLNVLDAVVVDIPMQPVYQTERSFLRIHRIIVPFLWGHLRNFVKRLFYKYYLRGFTAGSIELVVALVLIGFGAWFGLNEWQNNAQAGIRTSTGAVMISVLPIRL